MSARKASASARVMSSCATSQVQESRKAAPKIPLPDQRAISSGVVASCPKCTTNQASGGASAAPIQTRFRITGCRPPDPSARVEAASIPDRRGVRNPSTRGAGSSPTPRSTATCALDRPRSRGVRARPGRQPRLGARPPRGARRRGRRRDARRRGPARCPGAAHDTRDRWRRAGAPPLARLAGGRASPPLVKSPIRRMRALRFYSRVARLEKQGALGYPALMQAVLALVVGFVGGTLGGLIGLGGGFIMVPLLIYLFHMSQHDAQGTSLAVLLPPVGILSVLQYWRAGHVDVPVAVWAAAGFLVGGYVGGGLAQLLDGAALRRVFALFLIVAALDLLRR